MNRSWDWLSTIEKFEAEARVWHVTAKRDVTKARIFHNRGEEDFIEREHKMTEGY